MENNKNIEEKAKEICPYLVEFSKFENIIDLMKSKQKDVLEHEEFNAFSNRGGYSGPVIETEYGMLPLNGVGNISDHFRFYNLDTNFDIGREHIDCLNTLTGVEAFILKTRYRMIIAIGKLFDVKDVQGRIKAKMIEIAKKTQRFETPDEKLRILKERLAKQYKYFAIITFNGVNHVLSGNDAADVDKKVESFILKHGKQKVDYSYKKAE